MYPVQLILVIRLMCASMNPHHAHNIVWLSVQAPEMRRVNERKKKARKFGSYRYRRYTDDQMWDAVIENNEIEAHLAAIEGLTAEPIGVLTYRWNSRALDTDGDEMSSLYAKFPTLFDNMKGDRN